METVRLETVDGKICSYARLHKAERTEGTQTLLNQRIQIITRHPQNKMLYKIVNNQGLFIPAEPAIHVEPGSIYVRRGPNGSQFVRKGQQQNKDKMPGRRRSQPARSGSSFVRRQSHLFQEKALLEEELAACQRAEAELRDRRDSFEEQDRLFRHERQRLEAELTARQEAEREMLDRAYWMYHRQTGLEEQRYSLEMSPRTPLDRHRRLRIEIPEPDAHYRMCRRHPRTETEIFFQGIDFEVPCDDTRSPEPSRRHNRRRSLHRCSHYCHDDEASLWQRPMRDWEGNGEDPRLRRRQSGSANLQNIVNIEDRSPDDEWYDL